VADPAAFLISIGYQPLLLLALSPGPVARHNLSEVVSSHLEICLRPKQENSSFLLGHLCSKAGLSAAPQVQGEEQ
jgi:hypothetical protein